ncbi:uncharacterized protein LOC128559289 [Mercenaria mercenaria]|uniref:uncharacterized protein LOC128559289 n=1 Tax=Mercenaria mercenaria TaxID=6596 RepID=UPI00234EBE5E|nr:uncharacterized protein LOC128559289 [Mercenaria mercenaria]
MDGISTWLNGPEFILHDESCWPRLPNEPELVYGDSEIKNDVAVNVTALNTEHDLHEIEDIRKGQPVKKDSRLVTLNPVLVNGLIRMYGRQNNTDYNTCPVILPHDDHVTELIIRYFHQNNGHVGSQQVLAETRAYYWILRGPSAVKKVIGRCFVCKRQHSPPLTQQMAPLIKEQTTPDKPPFTFMGVDYFGPLMVKYGRSCSKRYGCLFTCLNTRAVHIEVTHSLTTDPFTAAYQRFSSRRGYPRRSIATMGQI